MSPRLILPALLMMLPACTGSSNGNAPLPSVAASFESTLPSTASVAVRDDKGKWGDVIVIMDSEERMAAGPPPGGETFNAVQAWLGLNESSLRTEGYDHVLLCHSAVNVDPSTGEVDFTLSEMLTLEPGGNNVSVKTDQPSDVGNSTTISCDD